MNNQWSTAYRGQAPGMAQQPTRPHQAPRAPGPPPHHANTPRPSNGSLNLAGFGHGMPWDGRPLEQRLYDDIYAQHQLDFPPNWQLPPAGQMPAAYRYVDAERAITRGMIKPFMGTIDDYPRFQQSFYTLIHIQPGPIFHKILALDKLIVDEKTVATFKGLGMSAADYVTRIQRLERDYGGPERLRTHHLRVMRHLKATLDDDVTNMKAYLQALETYLLNSGADEVNNVVLLDLLKGRMSKSMRVDYNGYKATSQLPDNNQTVAWFLHFKTTNEIGAREEDSYIQTKNQPQKKFVKNSSGATKGANQVHHVAESEDEETSSADDIAYIAQDTEGKRKETSWQARKAAKKDFKKSTKKCLSCDSDEHITQQCEDFYSMLPSQRRKLIAEKEACFLCLERGHRSTGCPKKEYRKCGICKRGHHFLLHPSKNENISTNEPRTAEAQSRMEEEVLDYLDSDSSYICCAFEQARKPKFEKDGKILDIAITYITVWLRAPGSNQRIKVNLLADSGANNCSLDSSVAKELGLTGPREPYHVQVGGGRVNSYSSFAAKIMVQGTQTNAEEYEITFQVHKRPCGTLTRINWADEKQAWKHLQGLDLPEAADRPVEGIIGTAEPWLLAALEPSVTGGRQDPVATKTRLGWMVGGKVKPGNENRVHWNVTFCQDEERLRDAMERFWNPDGQVPSLESWSEFNQKREPANEKRARQVFNETIRRMPNGQYSVGLLWRQERSLPYNYRQALNMFYQLERHMSNNPEMRKNFNVTIQEWLNKQIAHYLPVNSNQIKYILPTFMVVRMDKATTAYRLVVDGARKFSGLSINDRLLPGPSLIHHIFDVLCRMRMGKFAITCDVQSMYLNIKVPPEDQRYLCMFFRESETLPLRVIQLSSHPFGLTSSPYVAMRVVAKHAEDRKQLYPLALRAVEEHVIVDDFIISDDDPEILSNTLKQLTGVLQEIGMNIHKIASNAPQVLQSISPDKIAKSMTLGQSAETEDEHAALPTIKTLGVVWNGEADEFSICFQPRYDNENLTLRKVVSDAGRLFDPLGLVLPVTMGGRILQQACWSLSEGWDSPLPEDISNRWKKWTAKTKEIHACHVPRGIRRATKAVAKQRLITYVDASAEGQAAVTYVQTLYQDGVLEARLLAAKGKVSSIRKQESIPRLECAAAALGADFTEKIRKGVIMAQRGCGVFLRLDDNTLVDQDQETTEGVCRKQSVHDPRHVRTNAVETCQYKTESGGLANPHSEPATAETIRIMVVWT